MCLNATHYARNILALYLIYFLQKPSMDSYYPYLIDKENEAHISEGLSSEGTW